MSIESVMPSNYLILYRPLLLLPLVPPSIRVFGNESTLRMRWPKYWSFSFSIIHEFSKFAGILCAALSQHHLSGFEIAQLEFTVQKHQFFGAQLSLLSNSVQPHGQQPTRLPMMEFQLSYFKS